MQNIAMHWSRSKLGRRSCLATSTGTGFLEYCGDGPTKRGGISRSINLDRIFTAQQNKKLSIQFDIADQGTWQPIGKNQKYFARLVGNKIKEIAVRCFNDWVSVP